MREHFLQPPKFVVGDKFRFRGLPDKVVDVRAFYESGGFGDFTVGKGDLILEITGISMTGELQIVSDGKPGSVPLNTAHSLVNDRVWTRVRE